METATVIAPRHTARLTVAVVAAIVGCSSRVVGAQDDPVDNQYRLMLIPSTSLTTRTSTFAYIGLGATPATSAVSIYVSTPGISYKPWRWLELWGCVLGVYTGNRGRGHTLEWRLRTGVELSTHATTTLTLFNFTRYEYRAVEELASDETTYTPRLRNRAGAERALTPRERAWAPHTLDALADVEPFWRLDDPGFDQIRVRTGIGYIANRTWRLEFIYQAQFTASNDTTALSTNVWRVNLRFHPRGFDATRHSGS